GWEDGVPALDRRPAEQGAPLLHRQTLRGDRGKVRRLLGRLAQVAAGQGEPVASGARAIGRAVEDGRLDGAAVLQASTIQDADTLTRLAEAVDAEPDLLATLAHLAALPLLQACGQHAAPLVADLRWETGSCPVCAAWPTLAELRGLERARWLRC